MKVQSVGIISETVVLAGSTTVQWLDLNSNVGIRNFRKQKNGLLTLNAYNGPNPGWTRTETPNNTDQEKNDPFVAVNLRPNTPTHAASSLIGTAVRLLISWISTLGMNS